MNPANQSHDDDKDKEKEEKDDWSGSCYDYPEHCDICGYDSRPGSICMCVRGCGVVNGGRQVHKITVS